jgi:hypothetical protein
MMTALQVSRATVGVAPGTTTIQLGDCNPAQARKQRKLFFKAAQVLLATKQRIGRWFNPYATVEDLKGGLGIVLAPHGDVSPSPYAEVVMATKNYGPGAYCGTGDKQYYTHGSPAMYHDTLGAVPSDLQLSRVFGFMPFMNGGLIPFKETAWSPPPWYPPHGRRDANAIMPVAPPLAGPVGEIVPADGVPSASVPFDAGQAAVAELKRHQDRQFALSVVSTLAIASTAMIGIFKHLQEQRMAKRKSSSTETKALAPVNPISGARGRARRRRSRGRR